MPNEALLVRTLVELADGLVDDFDVVELFSSLADRCVEVVSVVAAGVMLVAPEGDLRVVTAPARLGHRRADLFAADRAVLAEDDIVACPALADVATIAVVRQRVVSEARLPNDQLNQALNSRVAIEQAKGGAAERAGRLDAPGPLRS